MVLGAGIYAFNTVNHDGHSHLAMLAHRAWALPTAGIFIALAVWSFLARTTHPSLIFLLCMTLATASLGITAYKGAELVYRHGLGVMAMPEKEEHDHHHEGAMFPATAIPENHAGHDHKD